jgi:hypothetical protein
MRLTISLVVFNCLLLTGCMSVSRPDAYLCGINAKSMVLRCYNLKSDFDSQGNLKAQAKPLIQPIKDVMSLNAGIYDSAQDFTSIKTYVNQLKIYYDKNCQTRL